MIIVGLNSDFIIEKYFEDESSLEEFDYANFKFIYEL